MSELPTYVLERVFDAPRALVWRCWTEPELLQRWYGPGVETIIHKLAVAEGGLWLCEMRWSGNSNFQRVQYTEVVEPERLVWLHSMADADWNVSGNPMMPDWPRVLLTTVTFEDAGGQTKLRLTWVPHEASAAEIAAFEAAIGGLDKGWAAGMEILAEMLAEMQV
ncbi:MAG: SRPBCC domain-containing protein [Pseudomonadota bacterium]